MGKVRSLSPKSLKVLKLIADGYSYSQIVDGNSDIRYHDIFAAAEEALRLSETQSDYQDRLVLIKSKYPKAYERWTSADDAALAKMHDQGANVQEMALYFQRQPSAIRSRLEKLNLKIPEVFQ